jgi:hypothetical protein
MADGDVERFEAVAGELLGELGYPRVAPDPTASAKRRAAQLRGAFEQHARARRNQLPEHWGR